jgi:FlaA1/EpsC-like NDP-sugar epimerase
VVLVGHGEHSLYTFERELARAFPGLPCETIVASLQRATKVDALLGRYKPDVIFHAGAHKHVPLMEHNIDEAVINNVGGTRNLLNAALKHGVQHFINISSDKAVNPTSIMGVTKRIAEYLVIDMASRAPAGATYASVRFGNVLGSRGSVVPLFRDQITRGGPVTITDERMTRYFMTIPEAAQLVLQAGSLGESAVVYVLDMGDPIRIVDLARDMIRLSGLVPDEDIAIVPTGQRPGEKLYEEPLPVDEGMKLSRHPKIYISYNSAFPGGNLSQSIDGLLAAAEAQDTGRIMELIHQLVPSYRKPQE